MILWCLTNHWKETPGVWGETRGKDAYGVKTFVDYYTKEG